MKLFPFPILCLLFSLLIAFNSFSQDTETLIESYGELPESVEKAKMADSLFVLLRRSDLPLAIKYLRESLTISQSISYQDGEALALHNLGKYHGRERQIDSIRYYFGLATKAYTALGNNSELFMVKHNWVRLENLEGHFDKALELSSETLALAEMLGDGIKLSDAYQRRATIYLDQGEYQSAIKELIEAAKILDTIEPPQPFNKAIVVVGIGRTEMLLGNYENALEKLQTGLADFIDQGEEMWQAITYIEIAGVYYDTKDWSKSIENYNHALEISRRNERDDFIASILGNLAGVFIEQGEYDKALEYLFESNRISLKRGSVTNTVLTYNDIASAYRGKRDYPNSIKYYDKAIQLADSISSLDVLSQAYFDRAIVYEQMGDLKRALEDQKNFQKVHDSVFNIAKTQQIEKLKTQYETEKKEQQISIQEKEIALLEEKQKASTLQNILLLAGILAISIIFGLSFYGLRQRMKRNKAVRERLDAELAFKKKELTTHALHLAKKNEVLESIKQKADELRLSDNSNGYKELIRTINFDQQDDKNWENFTQYFEQVHRDFSKTIKAKYPDITKNELRLMALLKMNLSSKEIATILNISQEGIKKARYRLRKKLNISTEESLQDLVLSL